MILKSSPQNTFMPKSEQLVSELGLLNAIQKQEYLSHESNSVLMNMYRMVLDNDDLGKLFIKEAMECQNVSKDIKELFVDLCYEFYKVKNAVYMIRCTENEHIYIGSSNKMDARINIHLFELKHQVHGNYKIQNDYNLYGKDKFVFEVLKECENNISRDELYFLEQVFINKHNPEYNIKKKVAYNNSNKTKKTYKNKYAKKH